MPDPPHAKLNQPSRRMPQTPRPPLDFNGPAYAELHCLSNFSFLRGASHPEELVIRAADLGYAAIAMTDRNSLAGVVRAHVAARDHDIHLIIGAEITPRDAPPIVLLAPHRNAYARLARLITLGRRRAPKGQCFLDLDDVLTLHDSGLIAIARSPNPYDDPTATRRSWTGPWTLLDYLGAYRDAFGDDCYLAADLGYVQPDAVRLAELAALSDASRTPLVATNNVHYHDAAGRFLQDVLVCVREKCTVHEAGTRLFPNAERHLRTRDEIARRYAAYPEALARTAEIAKRCTFELDELKYEYPHELVPQGRQPREYLEALVWRGAAARIGPNPLQTQTDDDGARETDIEANNRAIAAALPTAIRERIEAELALIRELSYEYYFLTVWDLVRFARRRNILCQGRGSAANSVVCYCLGVTAVDPLKVDLLFERFISKQRNEPPDIDIDFEHNRREEVFQYIYQKYGRERAAITAEVVTYRPRSAVRDVGKALGLSLDRVDRMAKVMDYWQRDITDDVVRHAGLDPQDRTVQCVLRLVRQILGFPRHLSQHVGGFVITETPLCEIVPLQNGAMPDRVFIEWDKDDIEVLGMLKVDCLALGMLSALQEALCLLQRGTEGGRDTGTKPPGRAVALVEHVKCKGTAHVECEDVSRSHRLAGSDRACEEDLYRDGGASDERSIRVKRANASSSSIDPVEHCRGKCAQQPRGVLAVPVRRTRVACRARNPMHLERDVADGDCNSCKANEPAHGNRQTATRPDSQLETSTDQLEKHAVSVTAATSPRPSVPMSLLDIPAEDPAVYDMICEADTVGVFQIESRAQMSMLPRLRPRCFYDLVIEVAIVRPGPIQGGMVHPYLRRRNGEEPVWYPDDNVKAVLHKTLGVPLFQEQVMRLAMVAGGFSAGEADQLRRAMAAWRRSGNLEQFHFKLVRGMQANGYSQAFAEQVFKQISGFAEYGFPESHSASFALLVYASAWIKNYYPNVFLAALLNSQPLGFYTPAQLIADARRHNVVVRGVDVNMSAWDCRLETRDVAEDPLGADAHGANRKTDAHPATHAVRLGMRVVRGLSATRVSGIVAEQQTRRITSIEQLARRADVSRDTLLRLAAADAFRSLGLSRRAAFWRILSLEPVRQQSLFAELPLDEPQADLPDMTLDEVVISDYDATGFSLNAHPIELIRNELNAMGVTRNESLLTARPGRRVQVAGLVTVRQRPSTAKGIVFMTLEDEAGHANLIVRPRVWEREGRKTRDKIAVLATGVIERQGRVVHVQVSRLDDLTTVLGDVRHRSRDFH